MSTKKTNGIFGNNPLCLRNGIVPWTGQLPQPQSEDHAKFESLRWGWRAAYISLFDAYELGHTTISQIVHSLYPASEGHHPNALLRKIKEVFPYPFDKPLPPPQDNMSTWSLFAEAICYGLHSTTVFDEINESWIGWAMAWNLRFNSDNNNAI